MKLSELKKMVAEEYTRYLSEQDQPPMPPMPGGAPGGPAGGPAISVEPDDVFVGEDPAQMLRNIYDMLKGHFEAEEMGAGGPAMPGGVGGPPPPPPMPGGAPIQPVDMGDDMGDVEMDDELDIDDEEEELAENSTKDASYQKTGHKSFAKKKHGVNAPYNKSVGKGSTKNAGYDASSKALQEVKRMQKLAKIIK